MTDTFLHVSNGDILLLIPGRMRILDASLLQEGIEGLPGLIQHLANFLRRLGGEILEPQMALIIPFLCIPVRCRFHAKVLIVMAFIVTDIPQLSGCVCHMTDYNGFCVRDLDSGLSG